MSHSIDPGNLCMGPKPTITMTAAASTACTTDIMHTCKTDFIPKKSETRRGNAIEDPGMSSSLETQKEIERSMRAGTIPSQQ
mmetsp:Transcript_3518/g.4952  ORF Transcript_3518/g.4952 Transcript_3518/m.4952 type:complete len:82 (+) Transcript_3518:433-678(+)